MQIAVPTIVLLWFLAWFSANLVFLFLPQARDGFVSCLEHVTVIGVRLKRHKARPVRTIGRMLLRSRATAVSILIVFLTPVVVVAGCLALMARIVERLGRQ